MIKPDAVAKGKAEEIKSVIVQNGFKIIQQKHITMSKKQAMPQSPKHTAGGAPPHA